MVDIRSACESMERLPYPIGGLKPATFESIMVRLGIGRRAIGETG